MPGRAPAGETASMVDAGPVGIAVIGDYQPDHEA